MARQHAERDIATANPSVCLSVCLFDCLPHYGSVSKQMHML